MGQNTSSAVMAQRAEPHDSLDFFPTPLWATRALCEHCIDLPGNDVWEPACGDGAMVRALAEYTNAVFASDVHDYGTSYAARHDFLFPFVPGGFPEHPDWIIVNPPFALAQQFIERALSIVREGVAVLVRTSFIESAVRYESLFRPKPPTIMAQFVERVAMVKGRLDRDASSATAYCWLIWRQGQEGTRLKWIPPCRKKLERPSDWGPAQ